MSNKNKRSFRIVAVSQDDNIDFDQGVYHGRGPGQAALKAFNQYCRKAELKRCERRFTLEEMTRGKPRKQFHYTGTRKRLDPPKEINRGGSVYYVHYDSKVHKAE